MTHNTWTFRQIDICHFKSASHCVRHVHSDTFTLTHGLMRRLNTVSRRRISPGTGSCKCKVPTLAIARLFLLEPFTQYKQVLELVIEYPCGLLSWLNLVPAHIC